MPEFTPLSEKISQYQEKERSLKNRVGLFGALTLGLVVLGVLGWRYFKSQVVPAVPSVSLPQATNNIPTPSPASDQISDSASETKVQEPYFERSSISIEILNGSNESGKATQLSEAFKALGYSKLEIGDASYHSYTVLNLAVRGGDSELADFVKQDLAKVYPNVAVDSLDDLPQDSPLDARIIVGGF